MKDFVFIMFVLMIVSGLIYFVYMLILGSNTKEEPENLQITSNDILKQANLLYRQRKYHIVESMAKKYLEKKPSDDAVRTLLTKALYDNGKIYESIEHAKIIIRHQPSNIDMRILLANFYVTTMKPMQAVAILLDVVKDFPEDVKALRELAQVYMNTNQKRAAAKIFKELEKHTHNNQEKAHIKTKIAQIYIDFGEFDTAIGEYQEILEIYPEDEDIKKNILKLYQLTSDWVLAIETAKELLDMHINENDDIWALQILSEANLQIKDYEKAMEYANLLKEHPKSNKIDASRNIAKILMHTNEIEKSIEILNKLVEENPKDIKLKKALASSYEAKMDFQSATNVFRKILDEVGAEDINKIHSELSNLYANWAMYLYGQNEVGECFKKFTVAIQYNSENAEVYYNLGKINKNIKNFNEAISQLKKAIDKKPNEGRFFELIAECYENIDNSFEQKKALAECIKHDPENFNAHFKLGLIYKDQHDTSNAINEIKEAIALNDSFIDAKYQLALLLELKGQKEDAIRLYEEILIINPEHKEAADNLHMLQS